MKKKMHETFLFARQEKKRKRKKEGEREREMKQNIGIYCTVNVLGNIGNLMYELLCMFYDV